MSFVKGVHIVSNFMIVFLFFWRLADAAYIYFMNEFHFNYSSYLIFIQDNKFIDSFWHNLFSNWIIQGPSFRNITKIQSYCKNTFQSNKNSKDFIPADLFDFVLIINSRKSI